MGGSPGPPSPGPPTGPRAGRETGCGPVDRRVREDHACKRSGGLGEPLPDCRPRIGYCRPEERFDPIEPPPIGRAVGDDEEPDRGRPGPNRSMPQASGQARRPTSCRRGTPRRRTCLDLDAEHVWTLGCQARMSIDPARPGERDLGRAARRPGRRAARRQRATMPEPRRPRGQLVRLGIRGLAPGHDHRRRSSCGRSRMPRSKPRPTRLSIRGANVLAGRRPRRRSDVAQDPVRDREAAAAVEIDEPREGDVVPGACELDQPRLHGLPFRRSTRLGACPPIDGRRPEKVRTP